MVRFLLTAAGVLLALVLGIALLWYLAYGVDLRAGSEAEVPGLEASAELGWGPAGSIQIQATTEADAYRALGYAHGWSHMWPMLLWRQASLGSLSTWFGDEALPADRLSRRLRLAAGAREAYAALSDSSRAPLAAYADGVRSAFADRQAELPPELLTLDVDYAAWEPWHALAIERLVGWMATSLPDTLRGVPALDRLTASRALLRRWVALDDFEHGVAWAARDSSSTYLYGRHTYGSSVYPLYVATDLQWGDSLYVRGATIPGWPVFVSGQTPDAAWTILLGGTATVARRAVDTVATRYERLVTDDGTEHLVEIQRAGPALLLEAPTTSRQPSAPPPQSQTQRPDTTAAPRDTAATPTPQPVMADSAWTLTWAGMADVTDWSAWQAVRAGRDAPFRFLSGDGLRLQRSGDVVVLGDPPVALRSDAVTFVAHSPWSRYAGERLQTLVADSGRVDLATLQRDTYSPWAADLAPTLAVRTGAAAEPSPRIEEALTYLLNWDFRYDRASIAASIFDTWMGRYRAAAGALPEAAVVQADSARLAADSTLTPRREATLAALASTFTSTVDSLTAQFGDDLRLWRWETVQPKRWRYPVWSTDSLLALSLDLPLDRRFASIPVPGAGHPTTLEWGASPVLDDASGPASWTSWTQTGDWRQYTVQYRAFDLDTPLGRYLVSHRPPEPVDLGLLRYERTTRLEPRP